MNSIKKYQNFISQEIEQLNLPSVPQQLYEPITYFLSLGGKRMRPVLTLMGCELFQSDYSKAKQAALAVELFHNFSLIHDDIMDEAPLRRGQQTVHIKWNTNVGVLSGDALLILAYQQLTTYSADILKELLPLFNQTAIEVCEGQQYDMDFELRSDVSIQEYIQMIRFKTAVLLGCSLQMGAIIGGACQKDAKALYHFGLNLGIAFQLQDDILDVYADQNKFGKQVGGDIIANKKTYLLLKAFEDADANQSKLLNELLLESNADKKVKGVKQIYELLDIKSKAELKMNDFYQ
ncbi:MAG TPA: polyprenyl synthetase family protein, partial [Crocinitomix sp.]|nr:polyprenyl synthetase family protein [Crocinitomix sp.]